MKSFRRFIIILMTVVLSGSAGYLAAQQQFSGIRSTEIAKADLGLHFECMKEMALKMTHHEIDPQYGGSEHSHLGRPEVFTCLKAAWSNIKGKAVRFTLQEKDLFRMQICLCRIASRMRAIP